MTFGNIAVFDKIREFMGQRITSAYQAVGDPFEYPIRIITITNGTDQPVYFSTNNVDQQLRFSPGSHRVFDLTANRSRHEGFFMPAGVQFYVKLALTTNPPTPAADTAVWVEAIVHKS